MYKQQNKNNKIENSNKVIIHNYSFESCKSYSFHIIPIKNFDFPILLMLLISKEYAKLYRVIELYKVINYTQ